MSGSLTVVGTGICAVSQTTFEARAHMEQCDKLYYLVADDLTETWIRSLHPTAESLYGLYSEGQLRINTYHAMAQTLVDAALEGKAVCAAFYGHPGVFVHPSHEAIELAREAGLSAKMLPGISAEDCLFADLGIDPGQLGCQSFEATDFLVYDRRYDPRCHLVLWQVGVIGDLTFEKPEDYRNLGLPILVETLLQEYPADHEVTLYTASQYVVCDPVLERIPLGELASLDPTTIVTLYVPPLDTGPPNRDMVDRLRLPEQLRPQANS
ncbi:MAG: SAM-dependent methyltransferase [Acidobacteriota bacterium]